MVYIDWYLYSMEHVVLSWCHSKLWGEGPESHDCDRMYDRSIAVLVCDLQPHLSVTRAVLREVDGVRRAISESGSAREERRQRRDAC